MTHDRRLGLNEKLIGAADARQRLATPALLLDLDALAHNITTMAERSKKSGLALRPHAKTHKSLNMARMQIDAGAIGICVATLREAMVMVEGGIANVHVTSPIVGDTKIDAFVALQEHAAGVAGVVDNLENLEALEACARRRGQVVPMLVDIDIRAMYRTGVAAEEDAIALAKRLEESDALEYAGVQYYSGIVQHITKMADRERHYGSELDRFAHLLNRLDKAGLRPAIVSGGGTGTFEIDAASGLFTENQAGSYVVMDVEYCTVELGAAFRNALFVQSTVISNNARGLVTTDAGSKSFAMDGPPPRIANGAPLSAAYHYFGDEFGMVIFEGLQAKRGQSEQSNDAANDGYMLFHRTFDQLPGNARQLELGTKVELVVPHCDPTVNLHDFYHCVREQELVDIWPVDARGHL